MLEITQEIIEKLNPLLAAGDAKSAGELLVDVDQTSLRAVLIHILRVWGSDIADAVGVAYLQAHDARMQADEAA